MKTANVALQEQQTIENILKDLGTTGLNYDLFQEKYEIIKSEVKLLIPELEKKGYTIGRYVICGEVVYRLDKFEQAPQIKRIAIPQEFSYGLISDTHIGSKACRIDALQMFYDVIAERGIKHVNHAGDLLDGVNVYKGQIAELKYCTLDEQVQDVVDNFPRKTNVTTTFIIGNHEFSFIKSAGVDVGKIIQLKRPDMQYLGQILAIIDLAGIKLELCHYTGSVPYSISYRAQKYLRGYTGKDPAILMLGHMHTSGFFQVKNTYCFESGTFQGPTSFTKMKGLSSELGGWVINIRQQDGVIKKIIPEWISFK